MVPNRATHHIYNRNWTYTRRSYDNFLKFNVGCVPNGWQTFDISIPTTKYSYLNNHLFTLSELFNLLYLYLDLLFCVALPLGTATIFGCCILMFIGKKQTQNQKQKKSSTLFRCFLLVIMNIVPPFPSGINLFRVNSGNTRTISEIYSKLIKTLERCYWLYSVFIRPVEAANERGLGRLPPPTFMSNSIFSRLKQIMKR